VNEIDKKGFQLTGESIDSDIIHLLIREVLEEKVNKLLNSNTNQIAPPQPSPRRSIENNNDTNGLNRIETPTTTPPPQPQQQQSNLVSPPHTPRQSINKTKNENEQSSKIPVAVDPIQLNYHFNCNDYYEESLLDETLEDLDIDNNHNLKTNDYNNIEAPHTPKDTPVHTPRAVTPSISPQQIIKPNKSISIQCDSLLNSDKSETNHQKRNNSKDEKEEEEVKRHYKSSKKTTKHKIEEEEEEITSTTTETTASSSCYSCSTSDDQCTSCQSTTTATTSTTDDEETYMSEGAWLLSKSEGQIVTINDDAIVNLSVLPAFTNVRVNLRSHNHYTSSVNNLNQTEEGELKTLQNKTKQHQQQQQQGYKSEGEIDEKEKEMNLIFNRSDSEEVEPKVNPKTSSTKKKENKPSKKSHTKKNHSKKQRKLIEVEENQVLLLQVSPTPKNKKNKIVVEPITTTVDVKETIKDEEEQQQNKTNEESTVRERKIFASTPDTSLFHPNSNQISNDINNSDDNEDQLDSEDRLLNEYLDNYDENIYGNDDYEVEEQEPEEEEDGQVAIDIEIDDDDDDEEEQEVGDSNNKSKNKIEIRDSFDNLRSFQNLRTDKMFMSLEVLTEKDQDTLTNMSDAGNLGQSKEEI
jgi:hypothetical protein